MVDGPLAFVAWHCGVKILQIAAVQSREAAAASGHSCEAVFEQAAGHFEPSFASRLHARYQWTAA